jgi:hypothetical protein
MAIFHVFLRYKKINKKRFIEIIKKGTHKFKAIIINLSKMKKSNQNCGFKVMDFHILSTFFVTPAKIMDMNFYFIMC